MLTDRKNMLFGLLLQVGFLRSGCGIRNFKKEGFFLTDGFSPAALQIIQRLVAGNPTDPGPFVYRIKAIQMLEGG